MALFISILPLLLSLIKMIYSDISAAKKKAEAKGEEFKIDQKAFLLYVGQAVEKLRADAKEDSGQAGRVEDQIDNEIGKF